MQVSNVSAGVFFLIILVAALICITMICLHVSVSWDHGDVVRWRLPYSSEFVNRVEEGASIRRQQVPQKQVPQQWSPVWQRPDSTPKLSARVSKQVSGIAGSTTPLQQAKPFISDELVRSPVRSSPSTPQTASIANLCPELTVPAGSQCVILLPEISPRVNESGILCISDVNSMPVLYVAFTLAQTPSTSNQDVPGNGKRLMIRSALEDLILASCVDVQRDSDTGLASLVVLGRDEERRGIIHANNPTSDTYVVILWNGVRILIQNCDQAKATYVTDEAGSQIACTRAHDPRLLQVNPGADAGLVVLALLSADLLKLGVVGQDETTRRTVGRQDI